MSSWLRGRDAAPPHEIEDSPCHDHRGGPALRGLVDGRRRPHGRSGDRGTVNLRFTTYVIPGPRGSGVMQLNGAAARLGHAGDVVILISYGLFTEPETKRDRK